MKEIKILSKKNHNEFKLINKRITETMADKSWFMGFSEYVLENMFEKESTLVVYGVFIDGTLAAVSLYDANYDEFSELAKVCGMPKEKIGAELGGSMVLPEYRGQNLMHEINLALIENAKASGIDYFVATAHPDNIASNRSLVKLGMSYVNQITRAGGYLRNVYYLKIK